MDAWSHLVMNTPRQTKPDPVRWSVLPDGERTKILEDLKKGGFGAELAVRAAFAEKGYDTWAFYYTDRASEEDKVREVDILAHRSNTGVPPQRFICEIIGEVKSAYYWVIGDQIRPSKFDSPGAFCVARPEWFLKEFGTQPSSTQHALDPSNEIPGLWEAYRGVGLRAEFLSTSMHQIVTPAVPVKDAWYDAALKIARASEHYYELVKEGDQNTDPSFLISIPLIVLVGDLLAAVNGPSGLELQPRDHAQFLYVHGGAKYRERETFVHIVTMEGLPSFLDKVSRLQDEMSVLTAKLYARLQGRKKGD